MEKLSALERHYLSSVLPFGDHPRQKQITKTKQFYKPESFIWNNPHRTSKHMYQYFHRYNDNYSCKVEPKVKELEEEDRKDEERHRIDKFTRFRQQTREKFFSRKKQRQKLQLLSGSRKRYNSTMTVSMDQKPQLTIKNPGKKQQTTPTEHYDKNILKIKTLIQDQYRSKHDEIRNQLLKRKKVTKIKSMIKNPDK